MLIGFNIGIPMEPFLSPVICFTSELFSHFQWLHSFHCNCYLFQNITICNNERQINDNVRLKNKKCQNIKRLSHYFFLEDQMHLHPYIYLHCHATNLLKQHLKWNRIYSDVIVIFNFAYFIYEQRYLMPH